MVDTRWACHCDSLTVIKKTLPAIIATPDDISENETDANISATAYGLLQIITKFEFVASLCVPLNVLQTIRVASDSLQTEGLALDIAFQLIDSAQDTFNKKRLDEHYNHLMKDAKKLAQECAIPQAFQSKRTRRRKIHADEQAQDEPQCAETAFKTNVFISSIDTCILQLKERFTANREIMSCFRVLTPKVLLEGEDLTIPEVLNKLIEVYGREINIETVGDEGKTLGNVPPLHPTFKARHKR